MPQSNNRQDQDQDQDHELKHKRNQHINSNEHLPQITAPQARTNKESQKSHKLAGPALQQHIDHVEHNVLKLHPSSTVLHLSNGPLNHAAISNNVKEARYAVRGALAIRAEELKHELQGSHNHPFKHIVNCNIGNPQQLQQRPITFGRELLANMCAPNPISHNPDVIARTKLLHFPVGAYSHSKGHLQIRRHIAQYLQERDHKPADPENIFMTDGASAGVKMIMELIGSGGVLIPMPQYPLYTATLTLLGMDAIPYYLVEEANWGLDVRQLSSAITEARRKGIEVKALVCINPGNPTGSILSKSEMLALIDICHKEKLLLLADEVYQSNVYAGEFISFKSLLSEEKPIQLVSFHSISKGFFGECGLRGGFFEVVNVEDETMKEIYKLASIGLCPNIPGQLIVDAMVKPPQIGDSSFTLYDEEKQSILSSLKRRADRLHKLFSSLEGVTCNPAQGALYLFPRIRLPTKFVAAHKVPDEVYCMAMLEETGVCVVPGSGFGQVEGTWHFRATFLPPEELFDDFMQGIRVFHEKFMQKWR